MGVELMGVDLGGVPGGGGLDLADGVKNTTPVDRIR
jgi:hypothetical protein